ncbi:hypothetical protein ACNOYE_10815 [Nannocystaceae bacterium ST9]
MLARASSLALVCLACVLMVAGCPDAAPTEPPASDPASVREPTREPEPEPAPATAPAQRWRFTTLVTGGPEPLIGSNGYYELELDGEQATLRKVGQTGTPSFAAAEVLSGAGTAKPGEVDAWPSATRRSLAITLAGGEAERELELDLWLIGDELHGVWWFPDPKAETLGRAWGLVVGAREFGDPIELHGGDDAACMTCVQAFWNCEGMSFEPTCNSANQATSECDDRMAEARAAGRPIPRGCGDWMD